MVTAVRASAPGRSQAAGGQRLRTASAARRFGLTALALVGGVQSPAAAAPEWRSLAGGVGWGACATVTFTPNPSRQPSGVSLRADLVTAAARVNAAVGRTVVAVDPGSTTATSHGSDGVNVVSFGDLGGASGRSAPVVDGDRITDADILLDRAQYAAGAEGRRLTTLTHEIGHALGLHHVADAHEIMSYGYLGDDASIGPGTTVALQRLYTGTCGTPRLSDSQPWDLPDHGHEPPRGRLTDLTPATGSLGELAAELATRLGAQIGGSEWASHAVVCRQDAFPDCLAGAALAGTTAPLLLVPGGADGRLSDGHPAMQLLRTALARDRTIYVLGGPSAVSDEVLATLQSGWPDTRRLAGHSRVETAATVGREVAGRFGNRGMALIARSDDPADAVTVGAFAAAHGVPVAMVESGGRDLHPATAAVLGDLGVSRTVVLGGAAAVGEDQVAALAQRGHGPVRVAGRTRSETAVVIARDLWGRREIDGSTAFVGVPGWHDETWALAMAAAPLAARRSAPILLTEGSGVPYAPPAPGFPGDTGWYLSHLTQAPGSHGAAVDVLYLGTGRWAQPHAPASLARYVGLR